MDLNTLKIREALFIFLMGGISFSPGDRDCRSGRYERKVKTKNEIIAITRFCGSGVVQPDDIELES